MPGQYYFCPGQIDVRKERVFVELMLHFSQLKKDKIAYMLITNVTFSPWCSLFLACVFDDEVPDCDFDGLENAKESNEHL